PSSRQPPPPPRSPSPSRRSPYRPWRSTGSEPPRRPPRTPPAPRRSAPGPDARRPRPSRRRRPDRRPGPRPGPAAGRSRRGPPPRAPSARRRTSRRRRSGSRPGTPAPRPPERGPGPVPRRGAKPSSVRPPLRRLREDPRDPHAELLADHDHLALGEPPFARVDVDRLADQAIQLDDRAARQPEDLLDRHLRPAELDGDRQLQVVNRRDRSRRRPCPAGSRLRNRRRHGRLRRTWLDPVVRRLHPASSPVLVATFSTQTSSVMHTASFRPVRRTTAL